MHNRNQVFKRSKYALVALLTLVAPLLSMMISSSVYAADLTKRSIVIGTPAAGAATSHTFKFQVNSPITIGSIAFEYCVNSPFINDACTPPDGFNLVSASLGTQSGATGFTIHPSTTTNKLILGRPPAAIAPPKILSYTVNAVSNPTDAQKTVFVRISTYASNNATGTRGDIGTVVFSTSRAISVAAFVPPYLVFCVGNTVGSNCTQTEGNYLSFGELTKNSTQSVTSQFSAATNDPAGYVTTVTGVTLTSGNNVIPAMTSAGQSIVGNSQFGMNLRANTNPSVGADKTGVGAGSPQTGYNTPNVFSFNNGNIVVSPLPSDFDVYTVSYIANISANQPPGVYNSTITYITTVLF